MPFEYQRTIEHPHVDLLNNLVGFVGEDIELGILRALRVAEVQFGEEMIEYKEITKGTRRYDVDDDEVLSKVRSFFEDVLYDFENRSSSFTKFLINFKHLQTGSK